jgi:hypothetical protein
MLIKGVIMIAGFTGTRVGMNAQQCVELKQLLIFHEVTELHHGMCIGADFQAGFIARKLNIRIVGHPPINESKLMRTYCDEIKTPDEYLERNHNIVDATEMLFAGPSQPEYLRSGTWATVRYARKTYKPVIILERG